jgi:hypothetical protein
MLNLRVYLWLGVLLAAAAGLSFSHFTAYRAGKANVRNEWAAATAAANLESFKVSERRQRNVDQAARAAAARARDDRARAASADRVISGLRNTLDATELHAAQSLAAATATVSALRAVFESCTAEYRSVGEEAAAHARDSLMYQESWPK